MDGIQLARAWHCVHSCVLATAGLLCNNVSGPDEGQPSRNSYNYNFILNKAMLSIPSEQAGFEPSTVRLPTWHSSRNLDLTQELKRRKEKFRLQLGSYLSPLVSYHIIPWTLPLYPCLISWLLLALNEFVTSSNELYSSNKFSRTSFTDLTILNIWLVSPSNNEELGSYKNDNNFVEIWL